MRPTGASGDGALTRSDGWLYGPYKYKFDARKKMTYKMNKQQFDQVLSLPVIERYKHFVARVADWQEVWTLKAPDGFVRFADDAGQQCVPVWPHPDYATALATESWSNCRPESLDITSFVEKWIPGMIKDKVMVVVFPTPKQKGIVVEPGKLQTDLSEELKQYD